MKVSYFCTSLGQKNSSWDIFLEKVKMAGYDGIETDLPTEDEETEFLDSLRKYELGFIGQYWETSEPDFEHHKLAYIEKLKALSLLKPVFHLI